MKILIDDADLEKIREIYGVYSVDGVTTNPTILAKTGKPPFRNLKRNSGIHRSGSRTSCAGCCGLCRRNA